MIYLLTLAFILAFSLLPPVYLRYIPFQHVITPSVKRRLLCSYTVIFILEYMGLGIAFCSHWIPSTWLYCKFFLMFSWIPYVLCNLFLIRPYLFQHIFILGLQSMYMILMQTVSMNIMLSHIDFSQFDAYLIVHEFLYTFLFILFSPILRWFFLKIFVHYQALQRPYIWKYCCFIPFLLSINQGFFMVSPSPLSQVHIVPRCFSAIAGITLALAIYHGIYHLSQHLQLCQKNILLQNKMQQLQHYALSLEASYRRMYILRHDTRHQIRILATFLQEKNTQDALALLHKFQHELNQSDSRRHS